MITKFRKKPVVIEAKQFTDESGVEVALWCGATPFPAAIDWATGGSIEGWLEIPTLEGTMRADLGDWIIKGVKSEFYPCKPDIFEQTYEPMPSGISVEETDRP